MDVWVGVSFRLCRWEFGFQVSPKLASQQISSHLILRENKGGTFLRQDYDSDLNMFSHKVAPRSRTQSINSSI